jgi:3-deoxy-D-manno-octulosonic-acid transferase
MLLYNLIVYGYGLVIRIASLRNPKARQWTSGRRDWRNTLGLALGSLGGGPRIWVHCASYGEFEQGRPLMEVIRKRHPQYKIVLSFFSPSGYEAFKNWKGADLVCYLPLDTPKNAHDFLNLVKPHTAIFIKYEFWVNFLFRLKVRSVPTFLVSAVFKPHHPFFKWYGSFFRRSLLTFNKLFVQDESSARLLSSIGIQQCEVCGDTRFDRVLEIRGNFNPLPFFEEFCKAHNIWVAGSTWPGDEELLIAAYKKINDPGLKLIIAPHNVDERHIGNLEQLLQKNGLAYLLYSRQQQDANAPVLVVDSIGLLSRLYHYARVTYVGGGFDSGIHNCLEPAVYLKPVLFYDHDYRKYNEVIDLVNMNAARPVKDAAELAGAFTRFLNNGEEKTAREAALRTYFEKNSGVTEKVLRSIIF